MTDDEGFSEFPQSHENEQADVFGPIDAGALREMRDLFIEQEPLVETASL